MPKRALLIGATGQDASYLAELLLSKGYEVHGTIRRSSSFNTGRIDHIFDKLRLHFADLTDGSSLRRALSLSEPDEVYNLGAQSHVRVSFDMPEYTADVVGLGTLRLLDAIRDMKAPIKLYQAGSSEQFGSSLPPQNESTPFKPRSPYGVAKVMAHQMCVNYRESYGMFICNGILFNHESPRRGETFVTRKITRAAARIALGLQDKLALGNLNAKRDWGFAGDYVEAMWLMLQSQRPDDYVVATGNSCSVLDFLKEAMPGHLDRVVVDDRYLRPTEVDHLCGNAGKIRQELGWFTKTSFKQLVRMMVDHDYRLAYAEYNATR